MSTLFNKYIGSLVFILVFLSNAQAEISEEVFDYKVGDTLMTGYLAYDTGINQLRPGVLVVHEWWGHDDYARKRARMLAELGYTALALDMYGDGKKASHPEDAGKFAGEVRKNMAIAKARFNAAKVILQKHRTTDESKVAAIGYCFGGGVVLGMARAGVDLAGVVSFHGSLGTTTPAKSGIVKAKILVLNGADDPFTKSEQITIFKQEMENANIDYQLISYPGAKHSFTNPDADVYGKKFNLPLAYNEKADKASWEEMKIFLKKVFHKDKK